MAKTVSTTCPYCGVGCGILATVADNGDLSVQGDPDHPANFGRLCSKGSALAETVGLSGRLLHPQIHGATVTWDQATAAVAKGFRDVIKQHGPDAVGFYVSGQLLTEDYYVANKLIKGYIGTANIDTNSRLCMSSSVAGHKRGFGSDTVPGCYEDLELADLVVLTGSNLAWCHPVLFQRLRAAKEQRGTKVVVIDPRVTPTCDLADLHLPLKPGSDVLLFNGLLAFLSDHGVEEADYHQRHVKGLAEALTAAKVSAGDLALVAEGCGLSIEAVNAFFKLFAETEKVVTVYSQGVNQSSQGTDKVNSILNCHLLTGRIGQEGTGPFSVTGQPNAMGGREVGGLANMLAAHMDFTPEAIDRVQRYWDSPVIAKKPGLKAVDLFEAIHQGKIKALWVMATNPAVSLPDSQRVRAALKKLDLLVVSDCIGQTDTAKYAHILLPAATWGERNGMVTNSERRISRQLPFRNPPAEALSDWRIICKVAAAMGYAGAFAYDSAYKIYKEYIGLTAFENNGSRDLDLSGLMELTEEQYDRFEPVQWPINAEYPKGRKRFFADGQFFSPDHKASFVSVAPQTPRYEADAEYPLILNTGRIRDQWHTMTRTGLAPTLGSHLPEPFILIGEEDANRFDVQDGALAVVTSRWGQAHLRVRYSKDLRAGEIFMPMHWSEVNAAKAVVGTLVNPVTDPVSGQPESKHTPVTIAPLSVRYHGFVLSRQELDLKGFDYWASVTAKGCLAYDFAADCEVAEIVDQLLQQLESDDAEVLSLVDSKRGTRRYAIVQGEQLQAVFFITDVSHDIPERAWLMESFASDPGAELDRMALLAGQPATGVVDQGAIICSCFAVGLKTIERAILEQGLTSVAAIGEALSAGTNCGSCIPELKEILSHVENSEESRERSAA